jgi:ankyrin repeat protein
LLRSVDTGNIMLLRSLVEKAACSLDLVDKEGNNLLHRAVIAGRKEIAKYISRLSEDLAIQLNIYGLAPVHLALLSNRPGLVEALLWITKSACDRFQDIKTRDDLNLLQYTVKNSHPTIVKLYLSDFLGKKVSLSEMINECNELGQATMHLAAASGNRETLAVLYNNGGDLNMRDNEGMLPFHHAISNGFIFTAKFIANLMMKNPYLMINDDLNGSSCLLKACENSFDPVAVKNILRWKGDTLKTDKYGHDAIYYSKKNKKISKELVEILLNYNCK